MEFVYVVPRSDLFRECYPQGLAPFGPDLDREAFLEAVGEHGFFVERDYAERNPDLKQVIPYTVVTREGEILLLRRKPAGGEGRLHNKLSIGVGGHINPVDDSPTDVTRGAGLLERATHRELTEELEPFQFSTLDPVGLINDDSNPVGAVHVGLVQVLTTEQTVRIREHEVLEGELLSTGALQELRAEDANFETWSAMLVDRIDEFVCPETKPLART